MVRYIGFGLIVGYFAIAITCKIIGEEIPIFNHVCAIMGAILATDRR